MTGDIELSDEVFLIRKDAAEEYQKAKASGVVYPTPDEMETKKPGSETAEDKGETPTRPAKPSSSPSTGWPGRAKFHPRSG